MYETDELDRVVEVADLPQSDAGAPSPVLARTEGGLQLAYICRLGASMEEAIAVVTFTGVWSHMFGMPNDEALHGHPLYERGLKPYGAFRVENSSWIRALERMNSVHERHRPGFADRLRHYVLTFHDSTFECVADGFSVAVVREDDLVLTVRVAL
jgi:hypothetical protein